MKLELIIALTLINLSIGHRQQRSTVLTDESKRILEQFDFSNFDKQEALNYIDRQRYDNQIRGKRSKSKARRDFLRNTCNIDGETAKEFKSNITDRNGPTLTALFSRMLKPADERFWYCDCPQSENNKFMIYSQIHKRKKRGHRHKKKHKMKQSQRPKEEVEEDYDEDEADEERYLKRKRKKKKKKRHYWNKWSQWSPCSVTCGRGRKIRWRKCIVKNCTTGELEMGEKTCQLPACSLLTKLLGL